MCQNSHSDESFLFFLRGECDHEPRGSQSTHQRPHHVFLLWASDPPTPLFLNQHRKYLWVHICTRSYRCFDLTSKSRPWTLDQTHDRFLWSRVKTVFLVTYWSFIRSSVCLTLTYPSDAIPFWPQNKKRITREICWGLRPTHPSCYFGNGEVKDLNGRTLLLWQPFALKKMQNKQDNRK